MDEVEKVISTLVFWAAIVITLVLIITISYYVIKHVFSYMGARAYTVSMTCLNDNQQQTILAGETITLKLIFSKIQDDREEGPVTPKELELINSHLVLHFLQQQEVGVLRAFTATKDALIIRFSLRRAGLYQLSCLYWQYHFVGSPLEFTVHPAPISTKNTILQVHNPESIPVVVDQWMLIPILAHDRYGNICKVEQPLVDKFGIICKVNEDYVTESPDLDWEFVLDGTDFFLKLQTTKVKIYKCMMTFMGRPIEQSAYSSAFMVISMNLSEEHTFRTGLGSFFSPASTPATLLFVGAERQEPSQVFVNINQKNVAFSAAMLAGIVFYPFLIFYMNRRTKITLVGSSHNSNRGNNDNNNANENDGEPSVSLKIYDGIQDSVTFSLLPGPARVLLATFGYAKGDKLKRSSFNDKKAAVTAEIGPGLILSFFKRTFFMAVDNSDLLASSIAAAPSKGTDWFRQFSIGILKKSSSPASSSSSSLNAAGIVSSILPTYGRPSTTPLPTEKWLQNLIDTLFLNTDDVGLFVKNPGSNRLHPNLSTLRKSCWTKKEMEFAGTLVGKYIYDSMNYGLCVNLTQLRFTKSFLSSLIGVPVTYQQFQSDYPAFYDKYVKPVLDNTSDKLDLKFETPKGFEAEGNKNKNHYEKRIPLIPEGDTTSVTQRNKIYYLNLLALQVLKTRHDPEIEAFRSGFYKVIPQGLVADFDIDELEELMCGGGGSSFKISDLKKHHRVVGDLLDHVGLSDTHLPRYNFSQEEQGKILRWFWVVISNLSPGERTTLLTHVTGSNALPTCGFRDLSPKFTISLTGGYNQRPKYHPSIHIMAIGNHSTFEKFEQNVIESLNEPEDMGIITIERNNDDEGNGNGNESGNNNDNTEVRRQQRTLAEMQNQLETEAVQNIEASYCVVA